MRRGALAGLLLLLALGTVVFNPEGGQGQLGVGGVGPLPALGAADTETVLMGAAPQGEAGEAWGYRELPADIGQVTAGSSELPFGPTDPTRPRPQLTFLRYTDATGVWQIHDTPQDAAGNPYRGPAPNRLGARITSAGGGVLIGRDGTRPVDDQLVVLKHDPGGPWRELGGPPSSVLLPAGGGDPAEALAGDRGSGAVAVAAFDEPGGRTGLFFGPKGRSAATGIISYDGTTWTREPIVIPAGSENDFEILAIEATSRQNAWALADADPSLGLSVVLLERVNGGGPPQWEQRDLAPEVLANEADGGAGTSAIEVAGGAAQPLTVTTDGVWIDLEGDAGGAGFNATLFYDAGSDDVTGSWCDRAFCDFPLGVALSKQSGYRSFAWAGSGFGTRVITNPLDTSGAEDSSRGTYLSLQGSDFIRMPGSGGAFRPSGAFSSASQGWLQGPVEISSKERSISLARYPVSTRSPLTSVAPAPGGSPAAVGSEALAVGSLGSVARYDPARGWVREFLQTGVGAVSKANLRGVAWPEAERAHAVGDLGAMWIWNADDDLWVADPGAPIGFEGNMMDVAFDPSDPSRGYAVGRGGVLLSYGKSWEQEPLPAGFEGADLTSIAFAGSRAIVVAGTDLLVNDGGGWQVDQSASDLLDTADAPARLFTVAALPDGGMVAAGRNVVIVRDSLSSDWRYAPQPLPGSTVIAAAPIRAGGQVRAIVSVVPQLSYPPADDLPDPDPNVPPPIIPPIPLPGDGYLLRETGAGWIDVSRTAFAGSSSDRPFKSDPALDLLLDGNGDGWVVGGWSGQADSAGRGTAASGTDATRVRTRVQTALIARFGTNPQAASAAAADAPIETPAGPVRLAVAGHAQCETTCVDLAPQGLGPDETVLSTLRRVSSLLGPDGPSALLYTGSRVDGGLTSRDAAQYASLLGSAPRVPVYPALGSSDVESASGSDAFRAAFAGFPAPLGSGAAPGGIGTGGIPGAAAGPGARTHYAFDASAAGGTVRVIVIDNSYGSLAASDPYQNPAEPQLPWLQSVLADAKADGVPVVVMGSRSLNPNFSPALNVATDAQQVAQVLLDGGASAYVFDRPEENRVMSIPTGSSQTIPSFGTGTLGYRSPISGAVGTPQPDALFGDAGFLMLEVDAAARNPGTNRAPVTARLIPVIDDLSLEAVDGVLLRRSRPALFRGLGRRPVGGDRWGRPSAGSGIPDPAGGDPYTAFPPDQCVIAGCSARIPPEYSFTSSDPDIADFVRQDPASTNLRKPFVDPETDKVVTDNSSGLLCPFNAGTTTVTVKAGGMQFSQELTVLRGSVLRPCGTRPLDRGRFEDPVASTPPPPVGPNPGPNPVPPDPVTPPPPEPAPPTTPPAPPGPTVAPTPNPAPNPPPPNPPPPVAPLAVLPPQLSAVPRVPVTPPPPPPPISRPIPPGGAPARVSQVEEKREEEVATEESQAFTRLSSVDEGRGIPGATLPLIILAAAIAGAGLRGGGGRGEHVRAAPAYTSRNQYRRRNHR